MEIYNIRVKEQRGRYSYLHPEREKYITGRALGTDFDREHLLKLFEQNALTAKAKEQASVSHTRESDAPDVQDDLFAILFIPSDLRLVVDLQTCIKAQQSRAYAQKLKISNLQQMAKTVAYIQENGFDTREALQDTYESVTAKMHDARQKVKSSEAELKAVNEQIHYLGQYLSVKSIYSDFLKARFKKKFRQEHLSEIEKYENAVQYLKAHSPNERLPTMKALKEEKARLSAIKTAQYDTYTYFKNYQKALRTACSNVDSILNQPYPRQAERQKEQII